MAPNLFFRPAASTDIPALRALAERVWRDSYAAMLPRAQIDYMLGWMYGAETIAAEMDQGVRWVMAEHDGTPVGYLAVSAGTDEKAELHKLYLLPELHGGGLGQAMLRHAEVLARRNGATELRLRVNKTNARALRSYARAGFVIVDALVADIGGGFVMDDYVLSKSLGPVTRTPHVKICGLSTAETLEAALAAGADEIGLVFFPKSPRHVTLDQARALADQARGRAAIVALTVDADDALLDGIGDAVRPDWLQLHGREMPDRVAAVKARSGRRVMKAVGVSEATDLADAVPYHAIADRILFDAKPPKDAVLPGGNGVAFDWAILKAAPGGYMLSGGLTPETVGEALHVSGAEAVDVSSGVESAPGRKDPDRIAAFVKAARSA